MKYVFKYIFAIYVVGYIFCVSGCGMKQKVSGNVDVSGAVEHRLSLEELTEYFRIYCESVDADRGGIPNAKSKNPKPSPSPSETAESEPVESPSPEPSTVDEVVNEQDRIEECVANRLEAFLETVR